MSELPLFPLRTVLFPGGLLPLRIFEPRYLDLVRRCLRSGETFGVVLIRDGGETGPVGALAEVGTSARILDFETLPDGLLGLLCRGDRRFRLKARRTQPDGLHVAEVEWLAEEVAVPLAPGQQPVARLLRRVLAELGERGRFLEPRYDDAGWVGSRLAELLPLERDAQQRLLELDDPGARLRALEPLLDTEAMSRQEGPAGPAGGER